MEATGTAAALGAPALRHLRRLVQTFDVHLVPNYFTSVSARKQRTSRCLGLASYKHVKIAN
jgi:hypothetical protein